MNRYTNPAMPASFSGIAKFRQHNKKTSTADIKYIEAYVQHKTPRTVFTRVKTTVPNVNSQWQIDMLDVTNKNLKYNWLLTVIDVFSRYAFVEPVVSKEAEKVAEAFEKIFERNRKVPQMIYSDKGNEFKGKCTTLFKTRKIYYRTDRSDMKAAIVERFNRTLRLKMERYITWAKTNNFIPVLQDLVSSYNHTVHPIHGRTPSGVFKLSKSAQKAIYRDFEEIEFEDMEKEEFQQQVIKFQFKVNDYVRVMVPKSIYEKATVMKRWSAVLYQVVQLCPTIPPTYKIKDKDGKVTDKSYYKEDLQKVNPPEPVEIVIKTNDQIDQETAQKLSQQNKNDGPRPKGQKPILAIRASIPRKVKK